MSSNALSDDADNPPATGPDTTPNPFTHLQHSFVHPTPTEFASLNSVKAGYLEERETIAIKMINLYQQRELYFSDLDHVSEKLEYYHCLTSPLRRAPDEVLRLIFLHCVSTGTTGFRTATLSPPWTLLLVCKRWHDVCLSSGAIWSRIYLDCTFTVPELPNYPPSDRTAGRASYHNKAPKSPAATAITEATRLLELQLSRSARDDADLYITIQSRPKFDYAQPFWRIIYPHLHRCVRLVAPAHIVAHTPLGHCARLRELEVNCHFVDQHPEHPNPLEPTPALKAEETSHMDTITSLPSLQTYASVLRRRNYSFYFRGMAPVEIHHVHRVTKLVLDLHHEVDFLRDLLPELKCIVEMEISDDRQRHPAGDDLQGRYIGPTSDPHDVPPSYSLPLTIPTLRKVSLRGPDIVSLVLRNVLAPNLEELLNWGGLSKPSIQCTFLSNSACKLRKLTLHTKTHSSTITAFLTHDASLWRDLRALIVYRCTDPYDEASRAEDDGRELIDLLTRCPPTGLPSGCEDYVTTRRDVFPELELIELGGMVCEIGRVVTMLASRRPLPVMDGVLETVSVVEEEEEEELVMCLTEDESPVGSPMVDGGEAASSGPGSTSQREVLEPAGPSQDVAAASPAPSASSKVIVTPGPAPASDPAPSSDSAPAPAPASNPAQPAPASNPAQVISDPAPATVSAPAPASNPAPAPVPDPAPAVSESTPALPPKQTPLCAAILNRLDCPHRELTASEASDEIRSRVKERLARKEVLAGVRDDDEMGFGDGYQEGGMFETFDDVNPVLSWVEGLQKEVSEGSRLAWFERDGLELWMSIPVEMAVPAGWESWC